MRYLTMTIATMMVLGLMACDLSKTSTETTPTGPGDPAFVTLSVEQIEADCALEVFTYQVAAQVHNAPVPATIQIDFGDGTSASALGTVLAREHTYSGCGDPSWHLLATVTLESGRQLFATADIAPCRACP